MKKEEIFLNRAHWTELMKNNLDLTPQVVYFAKNYDKVCSFTHSGEGTQIIEDQVDKICRFCGKRTPDATFSKKAHAIPELLGNKEFILRNECDVCNEFFGAKLEDELAKYIGLGRTLSQIFGKKGVPSYKSKDGNFRLDYTEEGLIIQEVEGFNYSTITDNTISFDIIRDTYTPIAVYKSLVKMALSILPYNLLPHFDDTRNWIIEENHIQSDYEMTIYANILERFVTGAKPLTLHVEGWMRKEDILNVPFFYFIVEFANYSYQIIVPCKEKDTHCNNFEITPIPTLSWLYHNKDKLSTMEIKKMSNTEPVKDDKINLHMYYNEIETFEGTGKTIDDTFREQGIKLSKRL